MTIIKKKDFIVSGEYTIFPIRSATGVLCVTKNSPHFISGHLRMRGKDNGRYPFAYKDLLEELFGKTNDDDKELEVYSGWVRDRPNLTTVDINPQRHPIFVLDGQRLLDEWDNTFVRYWSDPPYNEKTAEKMYGTELPSPSKLLKEGARVVKPGGLLFLLLGDVNLQQCPDSLVRIGWIIASVIPNQEIRAIHCYIKKQDMTTQCHRAQHVQSITSFI